MTFTGFSKASLAFLAGLGDHNDKDWFEAHRAAWDEDLIPAMLALCEELAGRLLPLMPQLSFVPRVGGSLQRLNRDIRFSRDKRPYKTHAAALLWEGAEKHSSPAVYLQIAPGQVVFGGGLYEFEEGQLDRYRKLCAQERAGERLADALAVAKKAGLEVDGPKLGRVPRGTSPEHPRAELLKHKGLYVGRTQKAGAWLHSAEVLDKAEAAAKAYAPLHAWLRDEVCK